MPSVTDLTLELLTGWALPSPLKHGDKEARGHVLVIAGSREMPGAALLAARAALRVGAGKLVLAAPASVSTGLALKLVEARVIALPETAQSGLALDGVELLRPLAGAVDAVVIGPGMTDGDSLAAFVGAVMPLFSDASVVLDALAMEVVLKGHAFDRPPLMTPHAGEMAHLRCVDKEAVLADPVVHARESARAWHAVVALKGSRTCVATPDGRAWLHSSEVPGLGTSGSGDVLAGVMAGLLARGSAIEQAAAWGGALHARTGLAMAKRHGTVGYLAREICDALPRVLHDMQLPGGARTDTPA